SARLRRRADAVASLERRAAPSPASRLLVSLDEPRSADEAGRLSGLDAAEREAAVAELLERGDAVRLGDALIARGAYDSLATRVERSCALAHRKTPLRAGTPREEVRSSLGLAPKPFAALVASLVASGRIAERGSALALAGFSPRLSDEQEERWSRAKRALAREPLSPPSPKELESEFAIDRELLVALAERHDLVRVGTDAVFLPEAVQAFADAVIGELAKAPTITVARARDLSGSSRKHTLPLMQLLDDRGVTRREGDVRRLVMEPGAARAAIAAAVGAKPR
ncbi:MAG: hypothetical protein FJ034_03205, partial [Chloroflexi bacterium]|nr:hypothetical protein [Chloroflexota bacterium]